MTPGASEGNVKNPPWVAIIIAVIGAAALIGAQLIPGLTNGNRNLNTNGPDKPKLEITNPTSGMTVETSRKPGDSAVYFPVGVTLSGDLPSPNLGIYVLVHEGGAWWIQSHVPAKTGFQQLEAWSGGGSKDNVAPVGQSIKVRAILADIDTVEEYKKKTISVGEEAKELSPVVLSSNTPSVTIGSIN